MFYIEKKYYNIHFEVVEYKNKSDEGGTYFTYTLIIIYDFSNEKDLDISNVKNKPIILYEIIDNIDIQNGDESELTKFINKNEYISRGQLLSQYCMIEISKKCFIFYLDNPIDNTFLSELHVAIFFIIFEIILYLILVIFSKKVL